MRESEGAVTVFTAVTGVFYASRIDEKEVAPIKDV